MKTTPQPEANAAAKVEAKAVSRPPRRTRSKGPLQQEEPPSQVTQNRAAQTQKQKTNTPVIPVVLLLSSKRTSWGRCTPHPEEGPEEPEQAAETRPEA